MLAVRLRSSSGYSILELTFVAGLMATLSALAVPQMLTGIDDARTAGAARYMATRFQRARMEAVMRSADVALQFTQTASGYAYAVFVDGNRNGVRTSDIRKGVDRPIMASERLPDNFLGVDFGTIPGLPAVEAGGTPPGADPIRLGSSNMASFTPKGRSSSGSVYIRGRRNAQYVVRIFGETGRTRVLKFDARANQWKPL